MTLLDIAQSMKGRLRDGYSQSQSGVTADGGAVEYGTAIGDSAGGYVTVVMDGSPDQSATYQFEVEVDAPVKDGDRIAYVRQGGQAKAIALETLSQVAQDAEDIATATDQHFWADTNGVHVSTDEDDPAGAQNIIMNSAGVLLREGSDYLAAFTPSAVAFYDGNGNNADNITASFGSGGATIGKDSSANVGITQSEIIMEGNGHEFLRFGPQQYSSGTFTGGGIITFGEGVGKPVYAYSGNDGSFSIATGSGNGGTIDLTAYSDPAHRGQNGYRYVMLQVGDMYAEAPGDTALYVQVNPVNGPIALIMTMTYGGDVDLSGGLTLGTPLPIASGGSGQTGTSTDTTISNIITAGTGITITEAHYCTWGKVAMLMLGFKRSSAINAGAAITIGSVKSGHRPVTDAGGSSNTLNAWLSTGGNLTARNISGAQIAANKDIYISFTYLLP